MPNLLFCEDSRGGWHGDGTLNVHLRLPEAMIYEWIQRPFKKSEWHKEFLRPDFTSAMGAGPDSNLECYWAKWGDTGNWRQIIVQPESGDVWYTEFNS